VDRNLNWWLAKSRGNFEQKCKFLPLKKGKSSENTGFYSTIRILDLTILREEHCVEWNSGGGKLIILFCVIVDV